MDKVPVYDIMNMAREEIANVVASIMSNNHIPAGLMSYIIESVLLDVKSLQIAEANNIVARDNSDNNNNDKER